MFKSKAKFIILSLLVFMFIVSGQVVAAPNQALTDPPPLQMSPNSMFDPDFEYLDDGSGGVTHFGDGEIQFWGQTLGSRDVDIIGVQVTLQQWDGSEWVDVSYGPVTTLEDASFVYYAGELTVPTGYYYRAKSTHWIDYGTVEEMGTRVSHYLYVSD